MRSAVLLAPLLVLAACSEEPPPPEPVETEVPDEFAGSQGAAPQIVDSGIGTPLEDRVATIGLLNKRNNISQDIEIAPGESKRSGNVILRLASCEKTAPWETPPETGAFLQVFVQQRQSVDDDLTWDKVFSGWLFKNNPSLNVVEHPIYDVWVKDCAMSFPGEESPAEDAPAAATSEE